MSHFSAPQPRTSWGRVVRPLLPVATPQFTDELPPALAEDAGGSKLAVGLCRSYGDSVINTGGGVIDMTHLDRIVAFDRDNGVITAEAGASLSDVLRTIVPHGWFTRTTPGTRFVTLGGAVANDVHGKNHHRAGTLGCAVRELELIRSDGATRRLSAAAGGPLFAATIGGLGLTGIIRTVTLDLAPIRSAYLDVERIAFGHVRDVFAIAAESEKSHEHTVAWIDCASGGSHLGRGIFQRANWSAEGGLDVHDDRKTLTMPVDAPSFALNGLTVRLFNALYYRLQNHGPARQRLHYAHCFYPLDAILEWNRLYGRRGFYQYQCVIPQREAPEAVEELLKHIAASGAGSFLAVLKTLGPKPSPGMLSFPCEGATLALDFPNKGAKTLKLLGEFDAVVRAANGRLYPAKDGRIPAAMFRAGYPQLDAFMQQVDPAFGSDFWRRVSA